VKNTKVILSLMKKMAMEFIISNLEANIKEYLKIIRSLVRDNILLARNRLKGK
jgi:hypothetical protein